MTETNETREQAGTPPPTPTPPRKRVWIGLAFVLVAGLGIAVGHYTTKKGTWLCCNASGSVCWNIPIVDCDGEDEHLAWCEHWRETDPLTHEAKCYD